MGNLKQGNKVDAKEHLHRFIDAADRSSPDLPEAKRTLHDLDPEWHPQ